MRILLWLPASDRATRAAIRWVVVALATLVIVAVVRRTGLL